MNNGKRIFGPVPSRRLGFSLGVDVIPYKFCPLDCVYCQLGPTTDKALQRKEYLSPEIILAELKTVLKNGGRIDYITFSGSGEPTLNLKIGEMIRRVKELTDIPVAVLTNGTLLSDPEVREELSAADLVVPSLDGGTEAAFRKVNRPHPALSLKKIVQGIADFTSGFQGSVWLEVMLVAGINDSQSELEKIAKKIAEISPEKVQLNTVVRPPAESEARPLTPEDMDRARNFLQAKLKGILVEVVADFQGKREQVIKEDIRDSILTYLKRRPATLDDLSASFGLHRNEVVKYLGHLTESGDIAEERLGEKHYFVGNPSHPKS